MVRLTAILLATITSLYAPVVQTRAMTHGECTPESRHCGWQLIKLEGWYPHICLFPALILPHGPLLSGPFFSANSY